MNEHETTRRRGAVEGNKNAWFWGRPDMEEAAKLLDLWASAKWHSETHMIGNPTPESILGEYSPFEFLEPGLEYFEDNLVSMNSNLLVRTRPSLTEVGTHYVDQVLTTLRLVKSSKKGIWEGLLLHLYPRTGPYKRYPGQYRSYRPKGLLCGLGGKYLERSADAFLRQIEREVLLNLIDAAKAPESYHMPEIFTADMNLQLRRSS